MQELLKGLESSNLSRREIEKASKGLKRDFPVGMPKGGADALRFSLCSYNFFGECMRRLQYHAVPYNTIQHNTIANPICYRDYRIQFKYRYIVFV